METLRRGFKGNLTRLFGNEYNPPTIKDGMLALSMVKSLNPNIFTIAKGSHFYTCDKADLKDAVYNVMDVAICGEAETIINTP